MEFNDVAKACIVVFIVIYVALLYRWWEQSVAESKRIESEDE